MTTDDLRTRAGEAADRYARHGTPAWGHFVDGFLAHAAQQPTRKVYSVQHWEDGDGIRAGWVTGYGHFTHSRADAEAQLVHDRRTHPTVSFRVAVAEITAWRDVPTDGAGS